MRAVVQSGYGPADAVLDLREIPEPRVRNDEVLVRVHAASLHPDVWHVLRGRPYLLRVMGAGMRRPKQPVPGIDAAGVVVEAGEAAGRLSPGAEVFGEVVNGHQWKNGGAFAEYVAVREGALRPKPAGLTFAEAAAVPTSGLIAVQAVWAQGRVEAGMRVLVNGAGGGVGTFSVQIAKAFGAHVTAVDAAAKLDVLRSIGADEVIDYATEDFTRPREPYDVIVDIPGNRSTGEVRRALSPRGAYVFIGHDGFGATAGRVFGSVGRFLRLAVAAPFVGQRLLARERKDDVDRLALLSDLIEQGKVRPVVDRTFPLAEVREAVRYLESGRAVGKIVLTVDAS